MTDYRTWLLTALALGIGYLLGLWSDRDRRR